MHPNVYPVICNVLKGNRPLSEICMEGSIYLGSTFLMVVFDDKILIWILTSGVNIQLLPLMRIKCCSHCTMTNECVTLARVIFQINKVHPTLVLHPLVLCFFFFFNSPCQFTPLLNLPFFIFGLKPFGWYICTRVSFFVQTYCFWFMTLFQECN